MLQRQKQQDWATDWMWDAKEKGIQDKAEVTHLGIWRGVAPLTEKGKFEKEGHWEGKRTSSVWDYQFKMSPRHPL